MKTSLYLLLFILACNTVLAEGNPVAGKSKSLICSGCHLRDGNSTNQEYPILAGQGQDYIVKQLADFKSGVRKEDHMSPIIEAVGVADFNDLAAYFSSQPRKQNPEASKTNSPLGKQLFQDGNKTVSACAGCHGADAKGNPALKFPSLAGQHPDYIAKMLKDFRGAVRSNDKGALMRNIAKELSDTDIQALAAYISAIP